MKKNEVDFYMPNIKMLKKDFIAAVCKQFEEQGIKKVNFTFGDITQVSFTVILKGGETK